jgi:UDP-glucose 4-epimerase
VKADTIIFPQSLYYVKHLFGSKTPIPADMTHVAPMEGDHAVYVICKNAAVDLIEHYYQTYGIKRFVSVCHASIYIILIHIPILMVKKYWYLIVI